MTEEPTHERVDRILWRAAGGTNAYRPNRFLESGQQSTEDRSTGETGSSAPCANKESPSPHQGASPSSSLRLTSDELEDVRQQLDEILEEAALLRELGVDPSGLVAHSARLRALQRGWLGP